MFRIVSWRINELRKATLMQWGKSQFLIISLSTTFKSSLRILNIYRRRKINLAHISSIIMILFETMGKDEK